jgi:hypothetical protein
MGHEEHQRRTAVQYCDGWVGTGGDWPITAGGGRRNADDALALALAAGKTLREAATISNTATAVIESTVGVRITAPSLRLAYPPLRAAIRRIEPL